MFLYTFIHIEFFVPLSVGFFSLSFRSNEIPTFFSLALGPFLSLRRSLFPAASILNVIEQKLFKIIVFSLEYLDALLRA